MNKLSTMWASGRAVVGFLRLIKDPSRLDDVFRILDSLEGSDGAAEIVRELTDDPALASVFVSRPRVGSVDLAALGRLPPGSLGRTFADEMKARGLDPADIQPRPDDGTKAGYVFAHLRETHDLWHTVTGFDVDVAGELGVQAVYLTQFRAKLALIILAIGLLNTAFFESDDRHARMDAIVAGWRIGRAAKLFGFDYREHWATPLAEVRAMLGVRPELGLVSDVRRVEAPALA